MKTALYIHLPFCRSKCSYCDFFSVAHTGEIPDSYLDALENELQYRCMQFAVTGFSTVYIGGGTPSLLSDSQLFRLFSMIRCQNQKMQMQASEVSHSFQSVLPEEITVEVNPADVTERLLKTLGQCGVTRISAGIQSTDQQVLSSLNRRSDAVCVSRCLELLSAHWAASGRHLSLDFISGLPGLSDEAFISGLQSGLAAHADHISLYALTLEEGTVLFRQVENGTIILDDEQNDRQWELGCHFLKEHGFTQYEVSNFSLPDCRSRHNCTYWHMDPYLGIGAGGTGTIGQDRWTNSCDIHQYTDFWQSKSNYGTAGSMVPEENDHSEISEIPQDTEILDSDIRETEFLMMGFRLLDGVSAGEYQRRFGKSLPQRLAGIWPGWESKGLAEIKTSPDGDIFYALTPDGILMLNRFLLELL